VFFKDLTKVEQLEERERLRDRLVALGEMAAAIAHEVKNPLAGIEVMAGVLKRQLTDSDAQSVLNDIINEAKMANQIVHEALEFVRPIRLQVEHTSINDVLQSAMTLAEGKVPRRNIALHVALDEGLPPIQGDHHQLTQLFTNLLINAFEALEGRGSVEVSAHEGFLEEDPQAPGAEAHAPTRTVVVDVADDGPGVPKDLRDRIFNAFFTTKPQGSGLGLAIVRKVVDAHDGTDRHSDGATGTHFASRCRFPARTTGSYRKPRRRASSNERLDRRGRGIFMGRILIADDHDALRRGLARALTTPATRWKKRPTATRRSSACTRGTSTWC
jgi:signal transduction histidine kinase